MELNGPKKRICLHIELGKFERVHIITDAALDLLDWLATVLTGGAKHQNRVLCISQVNKAAS